MGRRRKGQPVSGWIVLDKPEGLGSTQAVSRVRRAFDAQKAGHAGTLDPLATGVLPIALGEATKTVSFLMDADKAYRFTIAWGANTASFDRDGAVTETSDVRPDARRGRRGARRPSSARSSRSRRPFPPSRWTASAPTTWPAPASWSTWRRGRWSSTGARDRARRTPTTSSWRSSAAREPMCAAWPAIWPPALGACGHVSALAPHAGRAVCRRDSA